MLKLLIVDDEKVIREHIAGYAGWADIDCRVVGQAANGWEAFEAVQKLQPDVLITDIRMPVMDGIELAEWARKRYPAMHILFLTAYNEFEYAKTAVKLGVADFITKPFQLSELTESVRCLKQYSHASSDREQLEWEELLQHMSDPDLSAESKREELREKGLLGKSLIFLSIEIDNSDLYHQHGKPVSKLALREKIAQVMDGFSYEYRMTMSRSGIYLLLFQNGTSQLADLHRMARIILAAFGDSASFSVSIAISSQLQDLSELPRGLEEIRQCWDYRMLLGEKSIISFESVQSMRQEKQSLKRSNLTELGDMLTQADEGRIKGYLRSIYKEIISMGLNKNQVHQLALEIVERTEAQLREYGVNWDFGSGVETRKAILSFDVLHNLIHYLETHLEKVIGTIAGSKQQAQGGITQKLKEYIEQRYAEEISLYSLAEHLYLNYNYLSRLIKKETGQNFRDLLWAHRIVVAKQLLRTTSMKSYEIAYAVGFKDPAHFSQLFKKMEGVSPIEYGSKP
ncbi:response regulator [Paenibacillus montanisoli]|uniref:DNA-binding response regulator n=1 Tax=Paenibacillus montanisoli TaxID=2081970 RepID=A0A328U2E2_9BACL|nr:response regulator [Paenibacillus montanisoli]RAP76957.1 hypothetical protein DL346_00140 [Paenibacillus montanisoli]